ncbi:hypothetical protein GCM10027160_48120 [Streptomyces calidiresistens]
MQARADIVSRTRRLRLGSSRPGGPLPPTTQNPRSRPGTEEVAVVDEFSVDAVATAR